MKYFLLAIGIGPFDGDIPDNADEELRRIVDSGVSIIGDELINKCLISLSSDVIMLAAAVPNAKGFVRLLQSMQGVIESMSQTRRQIVPIRAVLTFGDLRKVDILGITNNFEGQPPITAARILPRIANGCFVVEENAWPYITPRIFGEPLKITGKHSGESYTVKKHNKIKLSSPSASQQKKRAAIRTDSYKKAQQDITEHQKFAENLLNAPLTAVHDIFNGPHGWVDPVDRFYSSCDNDFYPTKFSTTREDFIRYALGHLIVNPHEADKTEALLEAYVHAVEASKAYEMIDDKFINKSTTTARNFVTELIQSARSARSAIYSKYVNKAKRDAIGDRAYFTIVYGDRGVGKTILFNYLLTKFIDLLDKNRVLWVRFNLADQATNNDDLIHDFLSQTAKVVLRYYDPDSDYYDHDHPKPYPLDLQESLRDFIDKSKKIKKLDKSYYVNKMNSMYHAFCTKGIDPPDISNIVNELIARQLLKLIMDKGYSVVWILDGLDRIEASSYHRNLFKKILHSATTLSCNSGSLGVAIVVVTRTNTLQNYPEFFAQTTPFPGGKPKVWQVFSVPWKNIIERRIRYIAECVPKYATKEGWSIADWPHHMDRFNGFLLQKSVGSAIGVGFEMLGKNNRAKTQVTQLAYYDFLKEEEGSAYLFVESLVLAGRTFPPGYYKYSLSSKKKLVERFVGGGVFDNQILPSIFRYPHVEWDEAEIANEEQALPQGMLWGLRILQLVRAAESHKTLVLSNNPDQDLARVLHRLFRYPPYKTVYFIDEFVHGELIFISKRITIMPNDIKTPKIYLLPKGKYILDKFIYDLAYLNLCAMRLPINRDQKRPTYFAAASLRMGEKYDPKWRLPVNKKLLNFVTVKILNGISMVRVLDTINENQREEFNLNVNALAPDWKAIASNGYRNRAMFGVPKKMRKNIALQIRGIIESLYKVDPDVVQYLLKGLHDYSKRWCE